MRFEQPHFAHQIADRALSSEETNMNDKLEINKAIVSDFYNLAFNLKKPEEAANKYLDPTTGSIIRARPMVKSRLSHSSMDFRRSFRL